MGETLLRWFNHLKRLLLDVETGVIVPATRGEKWFLFLLACGRLFVSNRLLARASALAYTTLLALVPLIAVAVAVSTSLLREDGERYISDALNFVVEKVAPQLDLANSDAGSTRRAEAVAKIHDFVTNIRSGALGTTGMIGLVFVAIMLLTTIEGAFNDIWGVKRGRNWVARIINYWATLTLGPIAAFLMIGIVSGSQIGPVRRLLVDVPVVGVLVLALVPIAAPPVAFAIFYRLIPNTRVNWSSAFVGGAVGGTTGVFAATES